MTAASRVSSSVAGSRSAISEATFLPWRRLSPNSPRTALPTKRANWIGNALSRPRSARSCWRCCGVASWPEDVGDRVADVLEQHEGDERHRQHDEDGLDESAKDEGEHGTGEANGGALRHARFTSADARATRGRARRCSRECHPVRKGETTGWRLRRSLSESPKKKPPRRAACRRSRGDAAIRTSGERRCCSRSTCCRPGSGSPYRAAPRTPRCPCCRSGRRSCTGRCASTGCTRTRATTAARRRR